MLDLSLKEFGSRINTQHGYLSELENGKKTNPSADLLEKIASEFGVSVEWLEKGTGEPTETPNMAERYHTESDADFSKYLASKVGDEALIDDIPNVLRDKAMPIEERLARVRRVLVEIERKAVEKKTQ